MNMKKIICVVIIVITLAACAPRDVEITPQMGGMGMGSGMGNRHHATIPEPYTGLANPVPANEDSLARGEEIFTINCATCHGDGGMGDGPGGENLDPLPAPIAHTSQMMADDYLFWRISEGGLPFDTSMIPYGDILDEQARWDVINYVRALGAGLVQPRQMMGGAAFDPAVQATQQAEMLSQAVDQDVITQVEADIFERVHTALETYLAANRSGMSGLSMDEHQAAALSALVDAGTITQEEAAEFKIIHDRLEESGLMP